MSVSMVTAFLVAMVGIVPSSASTTNERGAPRFASQHSNVRRIAGSAIETNRDSPAALNQLSPGDHRLTLIAANRRRVFILHVPPTPSDAKSALILVFHGADETAVGTIQETDFEQVANQNNEVVVFLQGFKDTWNEGTGDSPAALAHVNDVAFTSAVINEVSKLETYDHNKVAAVGFSNGALMVEYLGCVLSQQITLIVPVEGELPVATSTKCKPARPLSVFEVHGTADVTIPYNGGPFVAVAGGTTVLSAPHSASRWAQLDSCAIPGSVTTPSSSLTLTSYLHCRSGVTVTLETIQGGVHQWAPSMGELVTNALGP